MKSLTEFTYSDKVSSLECRLAFLMTKIGTHFKTAAWNTLDINYHPPHVERIWTQLGDMRLMVHRIHHTDEQPLLHPHPWPSAVYIVSGQYEMGVGYSERAETPPEAATVKLGPGTSYEMLDPNGWHYVNPLNTPHGKTSISVMLVGSPWKDVHPFYQKERVKLHPLTEQKRSEVIKELQLGLYSLDLPHER